MAVRDIIAIGGSAGALEGVSAIASGLPDGFHAAVFVVLHTSPQSPGLLPEILGWSGTLPVAHAVDGEPVTGGRIYAAPPDHHLLLEAGRVRVTRGPRENRFRPAIDPLFRSAALDYGPRVVGVLLSGGMDDGTAGLWAIKARGGLAIVQDPDEAYARSMPESAMRQVRVDYCLRAAEIAPMLVRVAHQPALEDRAFPVPAGLEIETKIAMVEGDMFLGIGELGEPSPFTCPECHGSLRRITHAGGMRFRCHTGHAYTADSLLAELTESVEDVMWNAIRTVEESSLLMEHIASHVRESGNHGLASVYRSKAAEARGRAELVRHALMGHESLSGEKLAGEEAAS